jgi:hypothetical protein
MKTVRVVRDFDYRAHKRRTVHFIAGVTYTRVIEAAATAIEQAGAGRILRASSDTVGTAVTDASDAWRRRR